MLQQQQQQAMTWIQQQPMARLQKHLRQDQGSTMRMPLEQSSPHPQQIRQLRQQLSRCR